MDFIPPYQPSTPPPIDLDETEEDFGEFNNTNDFYTDCDGLSLPQSPLHNAESIIRTPNSSQDSVRSSDSSLFDTFDSGMSEPSKAEMKSHKIGDIDVDFTPDTTQIKSYKERLKDNSHQEIGVGEEETQEEKNDDDENIPELFNEFHLKADESPREEAVPNEQQFIGGDENFIKTDVQTSNVDDEIKSEKCILNVVGPKAVSCENIDEYFSDDSSKMEEKFDFSPDDLPKFEKMNENLPTESSKTITSDFDDDDFGDFESISNLNSFQEVTPTSHESTHCADDDFADFSQCKITEKSNELAFAWNNPTDIHSHIAKVCEAAFDVDQVSDKLVIDQTQFDGDNMFANITNHLDAIIAVKFNWECSTAFKNMLDTLKIDSRNILYGPNMPRFAASLSGTLEPLKPVPVLPSSSTTHLFDSTLASCVNQNSLKQNEDPKSQKDPVDIERPTHLDVADSIAPNKLDNISVNSLKFNEFETVQIEPETLTNPLKCKIDSDDEDEFSGYQIPVMLRETHISDIYQPPLHHSAKMQSSKQHLSECENMAANDSESKDEFCQFISVKSNNKPSKILEPLRALNMQEPIASLNAQNPLTTGINWPNPGVDDVDLENRLKTFNNHMDNNEQLIENAAQVDKFNADEWSDFVCASDKSNATIRNDREKVLHKPNKWQFHGLLPNTSLVNESALSETFNKNRMDFSSFSLGATKERPQSCQVTSGDDDTWTDFVSNQPILKPSIVASTHAQLPPPQFSSWNSPSTFTPNIIANPVVNFEQLQVYGNATVLNDASFNASIPTYVTSSTKSQRCTTSVQNVKLNGAQTNAIATISSLPDLEFLTPRGLTTQRNARAMKK